MKRFVWFSDTHLNLSVLPFLKRRFVTRLNTAAADGLFLTGDISSGPWLESDLRFLAKHFDGPIYFVLGNHDYHRRYIASVHADLRRLTLEHKNLFWLTDKECMTLSGDVAIVGTEGWYDASLGDPELLKYTTDWFLTFDFLDLNDINERIERWKEMARASVIKIVSALEKAFCGHKTVYLLTHFPPWREATRADGTRLEKLWLPYNTNVVLGDALKEFMKSKLDKRLIVLAGHTHTPCCIRVADNIECNVARASYWGSVNAEETIVI